MGENGLIELKATVNQVDYEALLIRFFPLLKEKAAESQEPTLKMLAKLPQGLAVKALSALPETQKERLAVRLINERKEVLTAVLEKELQNSGLSAHILSLGASSDCS